MVWIVCFSLQQKNGRLCLSTIVREIYLHHGDVKELVPEAVYLALKARREMKKHF